MAFLFLEVLPRVKPGVLVHIHDVHFPSTAPFPADTWLFGERWPVYWNEAMVVQTFLAFNSAFEVLLSVPMIRHDDEASLTRPVPGVPAAGRGPEPAVVLWLQRVPESGRLRGASSDLAESRGLAARLLGGLRAGRVLSS